VTSNVGNCVSACCMSRHATADDELLPLAHCAIGTIVFEEPSRLGSGTSDRLHRHLSRGHLVNDATVSAENLVSLGSLPLSLYR